jgi:uncharacterized membrane protein
LSRSKSQTTDSTKAILQIIKTEKPKDVKQLVNLIQDRLKLSEDEALEAVLKLQEEGKIRLETQPLPKSIDLKSYLATNQALWYWSTVILAWLTLVVVFAIPETLQPYIYIRNILGIIFVLWLPGYAFVKVLFPVNVPIKTSSESLDTIERIALSIGMSLALVPLVGLLLNYTPWGIRLTPIVFSLFALTVILATAAVIREHQAKTQPET